MLLHKTGKIKLLYKVFYKLHKKISVLILTNSKAKELEQNKNQISH